MLSSVSHQTTSTSSLVVVCESTAHVMPHLAWDRISPPLDPRTAHNGPCIIFSPHNTHITYFFTDKHVQTHICQSFQQSGVRVYVYVYVCVCVDVCMCACVCTSVHLHGCVCISVCGLVEPGVRCPGSAVEQHRCLLCGSQTYSCECQGCVDCMYVCMCVCVCTGVCVCVCVCECVLVHVCALV